MTDTEEYFTFKTKGLEWKPLLLLQFQPAFEIAIMLSIYLAYNCCLVDFALAYGASSSNVEFNYYATNLRLIFCCDIVYIIDIVLMMSYRKIQWSKMEHLHEKRSKLMMTLDIISVIPLDALYVSLEDVNVQAVYMLRLRYALRIFRFLNKTKYLKNTIDEHKTYMEVLDFIITYTLLLTTLSCVSYLLMCQITLCSYENSENLVRTFYIIGGLLVLQGNPGHINLGAFFYVWLLIINLCAFLYFVGIVISRLILVKIQYYQRKEIFRSLEHYALKSLYASKSIDWPLVATCKLYFYLLWKRRKAITFDNTHSKILPTAMVKELNLDNSWDPLKHSHLFRDKKVQFLRMISPYVKPMFLMPGEVIFKRNNFKSQMVYIYNGTVQILSEQDEETPILTLSNGSCIGETTLLMDYPATYTVICQSVCEVSVLKRKDFLRAYLKYPHMYKMFAENVHGRYSNAKTYSDAVSQLWNETQKAKESLILNRLKRTLEELLLDTPQVSESAEENVVFCTKYLDLLTIPPATELKEDILFLRTTFPWVFQPHSFLVRLWKRFIEVIAFAFLIIYPYMAAFEPNTPSWYFVFSYIVLALWFLDIYVLFSTAIETNVKFHTKIKDIALARAENPLFFLNILATVPLDIVLLIIKNNVSNQSLILVQSLRLAKCYKIKNLFRHTKESVIVVTYVKSITYLLLVIYYLSALLYIKSCPNFSCPTTDTFWIYMNYISNNPNHVKVLYACILSQKITSTGFSVETELDYSNLYLITIVIITNVVPLLFYMNFISSVVAMDALNNYNSLKGEIFATDILNIMTGLKVKPSIRNIVIYHIQNQLEQNYIINYKASYKIVERSYHPIILQQIRMIKYGCDLESIPLFYELPKAIIQEIAGICHTLILGPNEIVTLSGEACREIYILLQGYCKVVSTAKIVNPPYVLSALEMFLDISVARTVITLTHCRLIVIPCNKLMRVLIQHSKHLVEIQTSAQIVSENAIFDWTKENCDYSLQTMNVDQTDSFKHFGYYVSNITAAGADYHQPFDDLESFGFIRYVLLRHTIKTNGKFLKYWEISRCIFAFVTAMITPIIPLSTCTNCVVFYLLIFLDATAWVDIYVRHHVCYFNKLNVEVTHPLKTAIHYWKNAFAIDLIGVLPLDWIVINLFDLENDNQNIVFLKMVKLLQVYRIIRGTASINNNFISHPATLLVLQFLPITVLLINTIGATIINVHCKFDPSIEASEYFTSGISCSDDMWLIQTLHEKPLSPLLVYLYGFLYVIILTVGPAVQKSRLSFQGIVVATFTGLCGYIYLIYISCKVIVSSIYRNSGSVFHQQSMRGLIQFLSPKRLDVVLKQEIVAHFEYVFKIRQRKNLQKLIKEKLSVTLQAEILFDVFGDTMKNSIAFAEATDSFLKNLLVYMNHEVILNRGIICKVNDVHDKIYFILKGQVNVLGADYNQLLLLSEGGLFGSLSKSITRQKLTIVARGHVELLSIPNLSFQAILTNYVYLKTHFQKLVAFNSDYILAKPVPGGEKTRSYILTQLNTPIPQTVKESTVWKTFVIVYISYLGHFVECYLITMLDHNIVEIICVYLSDVLFIVHVYLNLNLHFKDVIVSDDTAIKPRTRKRFAFYLALVSVFPFEIISLFFINGGKALTVWNLCRANRLLKIFVLLRSFNKIESQLSTSAVVCAMILSVWISLIIQIGTSAIIIVSCLRPLRNLNPPLECKWSIDSSHEKFYAYTNQFLLVTSIFTSTALKRFPNSPELVVIFITLMIGLKLLSVIVIKEMVALLDLLLFNKIHYEMLMYEQKEYMSWRQTSPALVNRVKHYMQFLWKIKRGQQYPVLLNEAPYYLREGVLNSLYGYLLRKHIVFGLCHVDLIRQISCKMRPVTFLCGDYVAFKNDFDECMYFVHQGSVDILRDESGYAENNLITVNKGEVFGFKVGLLSHYAHSFTYRANQVSVIIVLKRSDWIYLLDFFPASKDLILNHLQSNLW